MNKHNKLLENKFSHAKEDLLYNSGGDVMWSLFRTQSDGVTIYYHGTDNFHIISGKKAKFFSLEEIAEKWDAGIQELVEIS
ncbi:hypothetical protein LQ318_07130 [Aliifodinibius salicampi]|uniref:Uncharacterized protein n=1 Tax=Fodinibius salicampi TaxID=1920655 RepID=A0ABT3PXT2_9BACT|nr:hypothetical protein [Fodinibius salicampi]MCW9712673.1 hypothetical protein [Fodinibius salicampi]